MLATFPRHGPSAAAIPISLNSLRTTSRCRTPVCLVAAYVSGPIGREERARFEQSAPVRDRRRQIPFGRYRGRAACFIQRIGNIARGRRAKSRPYTMVSGLTLCRGLRLWVVRKPGGRPQASGKASNWTISSQPLRMSVVTRLRPSAMSEGWS